MDHAHPPLVALTQRTLPRSDQPSQQALVSRPADFGESSGYATLERRMSRSLWNFAAAVPV